MFVSYWFPTVWRIPSSVEAAISSLGSDSTLIGFDGVGKRRSWGPGVCTRVDLGRVIGEWHVSDVMQNSVGENYGTCLKFAVRLNRCLKEHWQFALNLCVLLDKGEAGFFCPTLWKMIMKWSASRQLKCLDALYFIYHFVLSFQDASYEKKEFDV